MQEELLTQSELGAFFKMGKDGKSARRLCEKHGVFPFNVGLGTKTRLRWNLAEVRQVLGTLQAKAKPRQKIRKALGCSIEDKSVKQLVAEFSTPLL